MLPRKILVPTDFSPHAEHAMQYAVELAKKLGASLHLLHAYAVPVMTYDGAQAFTADVIERIAKDAEQSLAGAVGRCKNAGIDTTSTLAAGDPRELVLKVAADEKVDLIVMGSHGRRGFSRLLIGSVAESVARMAPCPVTLVHRPS